MAGFATILINLFVLFAAAKLGGALFAWIRQPAVVGELLAGMAIGPYALGLVGSPDSSLLALFNGNQEFARQAIDLTLESLAELGVIVLLFFVGLETRVADMLSVGLRSMVVGTLGVAVPFAGGYITMVLLGQETIEALFVAVALVATSTGITARILRDMGVLDSWESRIILGAAVIDDVLAMILLALVNGLRDRNEPNILDLGLIVAQAIGFIVFCVLVGTHTIRRYHSYLDRLPFENGPLIMGLTLMLGLAAASASIGLAAIIGAFLAGMILSEAAEHYELERAVLPIYEFLVPFFFVITGTHVDPTLFVRRDTLALSIIVTVVAVVTKFAGAGAGAIGLGPRSVAIVGTGMVPRGEVGLIVASLGLSRGVISVEFFSIVTFASIVTTFLVPPLLAELYRLRPRLATPCGDERMASAGRLPRM